MSSATLYRLSGISLLLGSLLIAIGTIIRVLAGDNPTSTFVASGWFLGAPGGMLVALGLPGIYARNAPSLSLMGLFGTAGITLFFLIFGVFGGLLHGLVLPALEGQVPGVTKNAPMGVGLAFLTGALLCASGGILLGIATIRAGGLPRWPGALIIAGALALLGHGLPHVEDAGVVLLTAGLAWLGLNTISAPETRAMSSSDVAGSAARIHA
ncbi:MAG: hypothetical protein M3014_13660 [Chloroflexota bacterium]|nr:hypothetical protein [Chloroflexota bacterium]